MPKRTILLSTSFVLMATTTLAQTSKEDVIEQLTQQGFKRIEISRTLFGNTRFEAEGPGIEREIVLGKDGTIVRDRSETDDEYGDEDDDQYDDESDDDESDDHESDDGESDDSENDEGDSDSESDSDSEGGSDSDSEGSDSEGDD